MQAFDCKYRSCGNSAEGNIQTVTHTEMEMIITTLERINGYDWQQLVLNCGAAQGKDAHAPLLWLIDPVAHEPKRLQGAMLL